MGDTDSKERVWLTLTLRESLGEEDCVEPESSFMELVDDD